MKHAMLLITAITVTHATIMPRKLEGEMEQAMMTDLKNYFTQALGAYKPQVKGTPEKGPIIFEVKDKNVEVAIVGSGSVVTVSMRSNYEKHTLEFTNVVFEDEREMIEKQYVGPFISHLEEVRAKTPDVYNDVREGLMQSSYSGLESEMKFSNLKEEGNPSEAQAVFSLEVLLEDLVFKIDPVYCELVKEKNGGFMLTIVSKFFQKSFQLSVLTGHYLREESRRLGNEVLSQLSAMYLLNEQTNREFALQDFDAEEYMDTHLEMIWKTELTEPMSFEGGTIKHEDEVMAECRVNEDDLNIEDEIYFTEFICELPGLKGETRNLVLPASSIYTVRALANRFFVEIARMVKHAVGGLRADEYVAAFPENDS